MTHNSVGDAADAARATAASQSSPQAVSSRAGVPIAKERADWLLDAVACATQDRRFLRGDPEYDEVAGEAILMNAEKAILTALQRATETPE